ncbi:DUF2793 domain-containing protein [Mesobaculum littorinae]|nr:DUF2793 domain-containing protein [Mesobaculum littorinae]
MTDHTARLGLPVILPSQAQKHVTHNEALQMLDTIAQLVLTRVNSETPPEQPASGEIHALGPAPTGAWAGHSGSLAQWDGAGWIFIVPAEGWRAWDLTAGAPVVFRGGAWGAMPLDLDNLPGVGVGAAADAANRLAVSSDAVLLSHAGGGHQLKINKAGAGETGSLLYQSNWTGHAEMGLTGDNDFHLKVSPDGMTWSEALRADRESGALSVLSGLRIGEELAYHRGNVTGAVSQAGGMPTGAVIQRSETADGSFVRFADGTQICTVILDGATGGSASTAIDSPSGALYTSPGYLTWTYPAAFVGTANQDVNVHGDIRRGEALAAGITIYTCGTAAVNFVPWSSEILSEDDKKRFVLTAVGRWF